MKLIRTILCAAALASLSAPAVAQSNSGIGAAGMLRSATPIERVIVGETPRPAEFAASGSAELFEGRSVAAAKRHCWVNVYGDRQCEYR